MNVIEARDASVRLGKRHVLEHVDLTIERGGSYALVGANGSGKSVLLRLLCGLLRPSGGTVSFGEDFLLPGRQAPINFGIIIDGPATMPHLTGLQNLQFLARIRDRIGEEEIVTWMRRLGLDPASTTRVRHYSQGMKQRLALAQAMMEDQEVLLLDEPFNALDRQGVREVKAVLAERQAEGGTLVFTSHIDGDVSDLAQAVYAVEGGTVVQDG